MLSGNAKLHIIVHALRESAERPEKPTPACGSAFSAGSESLSRSTLLSNHPALLGGRCSGHEL
jgi:hypothetical protein